ncbi:uncharacterized protein VP01_3027g5 [Puccinia sorghi]|uniref:Integrase catalytic domain-containing protein n=1 Tax=Puccinia sorghi TaxID=27349 RepID=A0A0L6V050_9BASI|nr:uncharacterized protein VP01_3027g5 [Puccinia sorghi]
MLGGENTKNKSDVAGMLITTLTWENKMDMRIKVIRSDHGGELNYKSCVGWVHGQGIVAEQSLLYHNFQNGSAER